MLCRLLKTFFLARNLVKNKARCLAFLGLEFTIRKKELNDAFTTATFASFTDL
jgi:hypothetical protein